MKKEKFFYIFLIIITLLTIFFIPKNLALVKGQDLANEVISLRTETSKTFDLGNGKKAIELNIQPIHYKDNYSDKNEQWKNIDLTIKDNRIDKAPYILEINNNSYTIISKKNGDSLTITGIGKLIPNNTGFKLQRKINNYTDALSKINQDFSIIQTGKSISIKAYAYDSNYKLIPINYNISNNILSETINFNDLENVRYPIYVDPTIDLQIDASNHDGFERQSNGTMYLTNGVDLQLSSGVISSSSYLGGFKFNGDMPTQNSNIITCYASFYLFYTAYDDANFQIYFEKNQNIADLTTSDYDISSRTLTTNYVDWIEDSVGTGWHNTPSLVVPMQEIVDSFLPNQIGLETIPYTGATKAFFVSGYDLGASYGAKLYIEYIEEEQPTSQFIPKIIFIN